MHKYNAGSEMFRMRIPETGSGEINVTLTSLPIEKTHASVLVNAGDARAGIDSAQKNALLKAGGTDLVTALTESIEKYGEISAMECRRTLCNRQCGELTADIVLSVNVPTHAPDEESTIKALIDTYFSILDALRALIEENLVKSDKSLAIALPVLRSAGFALHKKDVVAANIAAFAAAKGIVRHSQAFRTRASPDVFLCLDAEAKGADTLVLASVAHFLAYTEPLWRWSRLNTVCLPRVKVSIGADHATLKHLNIDLDEDEVKWLQRDVCSLRVAAWRLSSAPTSGTLKRKSVTEVANKRVDTIHQRVESSVRALSPVDLVTIDQVRGRDDECRNMVKVLSFLGGSRHRNLMYCVGIYGKLPRPMIVMPPHEPVWATDVPDVDRTAAALGVAEGLAFLHALGLSHGNLNENCLSRKPDGVYCLDNVGTVGPIGRQSTLAYGGDAHGNRSLFWAPELSHNAKLTTQVDLFALGVVLSCIFTQREPQDLREAEKGLPTPLLRSLLRENANDRPSAAHCAVSLWAEWQREQGSGLVYGLADLDALLAKHSEEHLSDAAPATIEFSEEANRRIFVASIPANEFRANILLIRHGEHIWDGGDKSRRAQPLLCMIGGNELGAELYDRHRFDEKVMHGTAMNRSMLVTSGWALGARRLLHVAVAAGEESKWLEKALTRAAALCSDDGTVERIIGVPFTKENIVSTVRAVRNWMDSKHNVPGVGVVLTPSPSTKIEYRAVVGALYSFFPPPPLAPESIPENRRGSYYPPELPSVPSASNVDKKRLPKEKVVAWPRYFKLNLVPAPEPSAPEWDDQTPYGTLNSDDTLMGKK